MKLPFSFSLKFVFRLLFPGFVVTLALFPIFRTLLDALLININPEFIVLFSTFIMGWCFILLDMHIYMAFEGRRYWPNWVRNLFQSREKRRLVKLHKLYNEIKNTNRTKNIELSVELRRFPLDKDGEPIATFPTRLGNIIKAYEDYPLRIYGMDSVFYWYRIWLSVDDDLREHIDSQQALADSTIYMSASLFVAALVAFFYAILQQLPFVLIPDLPKTLFLLGIGCTCYFFGYLIYRSSLYLHANFGELYKSMFDIQRSNVSVDEIVNQVFDIKNEKNITDIPSCEKYMIAWRYLHNYKIKTDQGVISVAKLLK